MKRISLIKSFGHATMATAFLAIALLLPSTASAQMDKPTTEALESYFEFVDYNSGTIAVEQLAAEDWKKFYVLDVRDAGQYAKEHIPGAVNIEWRRVFAERAKLPKDKTVLAYCNTGSFSAQVAMALRIAGYENVRILHGGMDAYIRAKK
jgi:rhodanese-related sulfurtransferase